jgi:hypothetical protein
MKIILEPTGEASHFRDATVGRLRHPRLQGVASALPDDGQKGLNQLVGPCDARIQLAELVDIDRRILGSLPGRAYQGERHRAGGRPLGTRVRRGLRLGRQSGFTGAPQLGDEAADRSGRVGVAPRLNLTPELHAVGPTLPPAADQVGDKGRQHPRGPLELRPFRTRRCGPA